MSEDSAKVAILCGAGVSMAAPASVPSWWGFNQSVLNELRSRFIAARPVPVKARAALECLSLDQLDVTEFSQVVSDAFAGNTWFDALQALDGAVPNVNHHVIAELAALGQVAAVATTNFDTLIERSLSSTGVAYQAFDALTEPPPPTTQFGMVIVKVHGTASHRDSLVDLANQKRRGLPTAWLNWLEKLWTRSNTLVIGFSGEDLALHPDYLRLEAASPRTPHLTWLGSGQPTDHVKRIVSAGGDRFALTDGRLPAAWASLGVPQDVLAAAAARVPNEPPASHGAEPAPSISDAIDRWLSHPMVDPDTCGIALTRLLVAAGAETAAQALRVSISTRVRRSLRAGLPLSAVPRAALQIGQLAVDEPPARSANALYCLDLAQRALDAVIVHLKPEDDETARELDREMAHNQATLLGNRAYVLLGSGLPGVEQEAEVAAEGARSATALLTGYLYEHHESSYYELIGAIAERRGDLSVARLHWEHAKALCVQTGNGRRLRALEANLTRLT